MKYTTMIKKLKVRQSALAKERDKLNDLADEIHGIIECCERADEALTDAIDALSELV